jgi:hypothetical protein
MPMYLDSRYWCVMMNPTLMRWCRFHSYAQAIRRRASMSNQGRDEYSRLRGGEIKGFVGIDEPSEN